MEFSACLVLENSFFVEEVGVGALKWKQNKMAEENSLIRFEESTSGVCSRG